MRFIAPFLALGCLLTVAPPARSQERDWRLYPGKLHDTSKTPGTQAHRATAGLRYHMSRELEQYMVMMDSIDKEEIKTVGFRIQIYSGSGPDSRKTAYEKQSEFLGLYPTVSSYTLWNYPNWVVRVGDFRTRLEALEYHMELRQRYPASFIMKDDISVQKKD